MRHRYHLLLTATGLLLASAAQAQQAWQPFRPRLAYQFSEHATPGDTTHTLRLASGTPVAGTPSDSLFRFTARVGRGSVVANCYGRLTLLPDNLFGATLRSQPRAVFTLAAANGRTLTLRPLAPVGQSWATGLAGLTASVSSRTVAPVLGTASDSVATIQLSDGQVLRLSKRYGLLEGPSLDSYLNGRNRRRQLTLTALPERGLGTALTGPRAIYDYQPGDVFQSITTDVLYLSQSTCQQSWQQDSVLTRQLSRTGDTLTYTLKSWRIDRGYGTPGAPGGFCSAPSTTTYSSYTSTLLVTSSTAPQALTSFYARPTGSLAGRRSSAVSSTSARVGGRPEYTTELKGVCQNASPDSVVLVPVVDISSSQRYGVGLGITFNQYGGFYDVVTTNLTAYRKGSQRWGTFVRPATLLPARSVQPAATTTAFPNPFAESLTVAFALARPQAVSISLRDALGRVVRTLPPAGLPAGSRQVAVSTASLPAGLYTLHLYFAADARTEVLKVLKAN